MALYTCPRCGATRYTTDPPHVCRDIASRLRRTERYTRAVREVVRDHMHVPDTEHDEAALDALAEAIVKRLLALGIADEA